MAQCGVMYVTISFDKDGHISYLGSSRKLGPPDIGLTKYICTAITSKTKFGLTIFSSIL